MESPVQDVTADETFDLLRDPYPLFARRRRESGVFKGSVMDWSKTPESMMPEDLYAAVSFDAVNRSYQVVIPRDAISGTPIEYTEQVLQHTLGYIATPTTTADLVTAWKAN